MSDTTEPYEIAVAGDTYQVMLQQDEGELRVCIYSRGRLRFSLPDDTPIDQVRKFVQVYTLGFVDGSAARSTAIEDNIRGRLNSAAQRLGHAIGKLKAKAE